MIENWALKFSVRLKIIRDNTDCFPFLLFSCSVVSNSLWSHEAHQASLSFPISQNLLKLVSVESGMSSNYLILSCPLLLLPSIFPSIRIFSNKLALHIRWPKYWSFSISPSNEYSQFISFRVDWFDLLAVQGALPVLFRLNLWSTPMVNWRNSHLG